MVGPSSVLEEDREVVLEGAASSGLIAPDLGQFHSSGTGTHRQCP